MRGIVSQEEVRGGGRKGVRRETWGVSEGQEQVEDIIESPDREPLQGTQEQSPSGAPLLPETNVPQSPGSLCWRLWYLASSVSPRSLGLRLRAEKHSEGGKEGGRVCPASLFALSRRLNQFISGSDDFISCGSRQPLSGLRGKIGPGTI